MPVELLLQVGLGIDGSTSALIGTPNSRLQRVQTGTTGVELSHLTTLRLRFFGGLFFSTID